MSAIADRYEEYLQKYETYQTKKQQIDKMHKLVSAVEQKLEKAKENIKRKEQLRAEAESKSKKAEAERKEFRPLYDRESKRRSYESEIETFKKNLTCKEGNLVDDGIYQAKQKAIISAYEEKEKKYYDERKQELEREKAQIQTELDCLDKDRETFAENKKEQICPGCKSVIDAKKDEIDLYLSCNSQIKNSECTERIQRILNEQKPEAAQCGMSEEALLQTVLSLKGTEEYARKNVVTHKDIVFHSEDYKSIRMPFLIGAGVVLFLIFAFVFSPGNFILPSSATFTGAGHTVIQMIVRIGCSLFFGAIVGGVIYGILRMFGMDVIAGIAGILIGLCGFGYVYRGQYLVISENSLSGFGGGLHFILVWLIQILIGGGIIFLLAYLTEETELARFFYKPVKNRVLEDLSRFEAYVNANRESYIALYHINEAIGYACENRLKNEILGCDKNIDGIRNDRTYTGMVNGCKNEMKGLRDKRQRQINLVAQKRKELSDKEDSRLESLKRRKENLEAADVEAKSNFKGRVRDLARAQEEEKDCSTLLNQKMDEERALVEGAEDEKHWLEERTKELCADHSELVKGFTELNNAQALLECGGNLEDYYYFVENKKDENEMAVIQKVPLNCRPTIFVYEKDCIKGNSLGDELSGFIEWFCDSIRRTTPETILMDPNRKGLFTIVDVTSGGGGLEDLPYIGEVVSDEKAKDDIVEMLTEQKEKIKEQVGRSDVKKYNRGNTIHDLNQVIMEMNRKDIEAGVPIDQFMDAIVPYRVIIFIVSPTIMDTASRSVMNEEIILLLKNSERLGIMPVFLIDDENWTNPKASSDVKVLYGMDKAVWKIRNLGKTQQNTMFLEALS